jgi:hypothetical protein
VTANTQTLYKPPHVLDHVVDRCLDFGFPVSRCLPTHTRVVRTSLLSSSIAQIRRQIPVFSSIQRAS